MESKQAPGGKSNFSLDWSSNTSSGTNLERKSTLDIKAKARRNDVQYKTNNIFEEKSQSSTPSNSNVQKKRQQQPFASHDEVIPQIQSKKSVEPTPFATESNNNISSQLLKGGRKYFTKDNNEKTNRPFASHDIIENQSTGIISGGRAKADQTKQQKNAPFAMHNNSEEVKQSYNSGKARPDRIPGSNNGFQLSDNSGLADSDRFKTSKQQANQQVQNSTNVGKTSYAAGTVRNQHVQGTQAGVKSQITF